MIQITPQMRILLAVEPVDFRKGIGGLAAVCRASLDSDPLAGALFVLPLDQEPFDGTLRDLGPLEVRQVCRQEGEGLFNQLKELWVYPFRGARTVAVAHPQFHPGDLCPDCQDAKLYNLPPALILRLVGQAPVAATCFELERLCRRRLPDRPGGPTRRHP